MLYKRPARRATAATRLKVFRRYARRRRTIVVIVVSPSRSRVVFADHGSAVVAPVLDLRVKDSADRFVPGRSLMGETGREPSRERPRPNMCWKENCRRVLSAGLCERFVELCGGGAGPGEPAVFGS